MVSKKDKNTARVKRHERIRVHISGTAQRPRLCVYRSNKHISAQIIDDVKGVTLVSASTQEKSFEGIGSNKAAAREIGKIIGKRAIEKGIETVVFDRSGYLYHGRVSELADGARESGLQF
ncbi:MAG: 50S ribosomal protein L18 [Firmicutes bacterium]|nr:50S ribosomal protein L18 [Bacillota bacterium]MCD7783085.1 50S ribosomal protein L18 [Bacillota bacterium]MCD7831573.1 50S ribosomal protein L18 [Bacillota bacterium]MCD8314698.1 50S ribosomal protein L18 [Bacillota bacterium]